MLRLSVESSCWAMAKSSCSCKIVSIYCCLEVLVFPLSDSIWVLWSSNSRDLFSRLVFKLSLTVFNLITSSFREFNSVTWVLDNFCSLVNVFNLVMTAACSYLTVSSSFFILFDSWRRSANSLLFIELSCVSVVLVKSKSEIWCFRFSISDVALFNSLKTVR